MSYTEIATPMPLLPLRYTHDAAPCPTFLDRTGEYKKCACARSNPYDTFQSRQKRLRHATLVFIFFVSH